MLPRKLRAERASRWPCLPLIMCRQVRLPSCSCCLHLVRGCAHPLTSFSLLGLSPLAPQSLNPKRTCWRRGVHTSCTFSSAARRGADFSAYAADSAPGWQARQTLLLPLPPPLPPGRTRTRRSYDNCRCPCIASAGCSTACSAARTLPGCLQAPLPAALKLCL